MRLSKRHTEQAPTVSTPFDSYRTHRTSSVTVGQNYMPVVVETHRHNPIQPKTGIPVSPMHRLPIRAKREMDVQGCSLSLYKSCRPAQSYTAGLTSFTADHAGGGQSGTPVGNNFLRSQGNHDGHCTGRAALRIANNHLYIGERMNDKPKPTIFIADPDCPICHGTGIRCIPNGPDDYDREACDCQPYIKGDE